MIFVSVMLYELARELGLQGAVQEFHAQLADRDKRDVMPCVRVVERLRHFDEVKLCLDPGATGITKARSRHAHEFHEATDCDVWVCVDDDVDAEDETCRGIVQLARFRQALVLAPCWLRDGRHVNVALREPPIALQWGELSYFAALMGGFGLVAMHRDPFEQVRDMFDVETLRYVDDDDRTKVALFRDVIEHGRWWSEDLSFCHRVRATRLEILALATGATMHADRVLDLRTLEQQPRLVLNPEQ